MNILVIGSKGFIGSQCARHFAGAHTVYGCDVAEDHERNYFQYKGPPTFSEVFSAVKFDLCINASGSPGVAF